MHLPTILVLSVHFASAFGWYTAENEKQQEKQLCIVQEDTEGGDDAPAIIEAFSDCGQGGKVVFKNVTYHVNSEMNTTGLKDCEIDLYGTLLVGHPNLR